MFETQIAKGMALLDAKFPGWSMHINLDMLALSVPSFPVTFDPAEAKAMGECGCILAQLGVLIPYGTFRRRDQERGGYLEMLDIVFGPRGTSMPVAEVAEFGFTLDGECEVTDAWHRLTQEWKTALLARRV